MTYIYAFCAWFCAAYILARLVGESIAWGAGEPRPAPDGVVLDEDC